MNIINENTEKLLEILEKVQDLPETLNNVEQANPTISVSSGGLITASATQRAGVVSAGTKTSTRQLPTKGGTTITPGDVEQTAVPAGTFVTGDIKVGAINSGLHGVTGTIRPTGSRISTMTISPGIDPKIFILYNTYERWTYVKTDEGVLLSNGLTKDYTSDVNVNVVVNNGVITLTLPTQILNGEGLPGASSITPTFRTVQYSWIAVE